MASKMVATRADPVAQASCGILAWRKGLGHRNRHNGPWPQPMAVGQLHGPWAMIMGGGSRPCMATSSRAMVMVVAMTIGPRHRHVLSLEAIGCLSSHRASVHSSASVLSLGVRSLGFCLVVIELPKCSYK